MIVTYDFWYIANGEGFRCRGEGWPWHIYPQRGDMLVIEIKYD